MYHVVFDMIILGVSVICGYKFLLRIFIRFNYMRLHDFSMHRATMIDIMPCCTILNKRSLF